MKTDIRRYLAADSAARRLKFNTETGKSSVHTDNQQDPPSERFGSQTALNSAGKAIVRKPADFSKSFLKLNKLSVPNQRRTPYAGAELGKFDLNQQILEKASTISAKHQKAIIGPGTGKKAVA